MIYLKWVFWVTVWLFVGAFLHYTLPQHDIVRIVGTEVRRVDFGSNSLFWAQQDTGQKSTTGLNRDVRFIDTVQAKNGKVMVYRNEDTGWGWPPYFKLDSSNPQAEASDLISTKDAPQWVVILHYGWRAEFLSIFPNAISVKPVSGPDHRIINWFNIVFLTFFFAIIYAIWVRWCRFRAARIDPVLDDWNDRLSDAGESLSARRDRFKRWISGRSKP